MKKLVWLLVLMLLLGACSMKAEKTTLQATETLPSEAETQPETVPTEPPEQRVLFTFVGDCTLGCNSSHNRAGYGFLLTVGEQYDYPFQNVKEWFENDDFTMINLEGVLGNKGTPAGKKFAFRGPASYVNFLTENSIEAVSLANNHTLDYGETGYAETRRLLDEAGVPYVEQNSGTIITLENGITVGIYGTVYNSIHQASPVEGIVALKEQGADIVIYAPHWGTEHSFRATSQQVELGHAAIDAGADIVYGCHPHVLQPVEEYSDGVIYYSLGNFCFGGNIYPSDYDTAIIQQEVILAANGTVTLGERTIIPCSLSSMEKRNNYQPTPYEKGTEEYDRVLSKLNGTYTGSNLPVH
jgi:poly-gamma-glutamate synthesis protein (capsule biosynthesis protein)